MIQQETKLKVADNTGAKIIQCIRVVGGTGRRYAHVGDTIIVSIKKYYCAREFSNVTILRF